MKAAFVGRFQPFHNGHMHAIQQFEEDYEIIIVIGDSSSREEQNPLTFEERIKIIGSCVEKEVVTLENHESDAVWTGNLLDASGADAVISRNKWTLEAVQEHSEVEILKQDFKNRDLYSGTEIRRRIRSGEEWRYLVPDCAEDKISDLEQIIKKSGKNYEFEPGWKKENAFHDTAED